MLGVPTPVIDAEITLAETLLGRDFRGIGRTVEKMGISPAGDLKALNRHLQEIQCHVVILLGAFEAHKRVHYIYLIFWVSSQRTPSDSLRVSKVSLFFRKNND
jgi:hypothetical protein